MQLTYVDRLYLNKHEKEEIDFLMKNATKFFMTVFNTLFFEERYYKKHHLADVKEATAHFKNIEFCSKFHIGTKYANSLIRLAKDRISLHRESHKQKIEDKELRLKLLNKDIKKITKNKKKADLTKKEKIASGLCCLNSLTKSHIATKSLNGFSPFAFKVWSSGVAPNEIIFFLLSSL